MLKMDLHKLQTKLRNKKNKTWKCHICNQYYTVQNKYNHVISIKHKNNIKNYN